MSNYIETSTGIIKIPRKRSIKGLSKTQYEVVILGNYGIPNTHVKCGDELEVVTVYQTLKDIYKFGDIY